MEISTNVKDTKKDLAKSLEREHTLLDEALCGEDLHLLQNDLVVSFDILLIPVDLSND